MWCVVIVGEDADDLSTVGPFASEAEAGAWNGTGSNATVEAIRYVLPLEAP